MVKKLRQPKPRGAAAITWQTLTPYERATLLGQPRPPDEQEQFYGEWWGLHGSDPLFRQGRPSLRQLFEACEDEVRANWRHTWPPPYVRHWAN